MIKPVYIDLAMSLISILYGLYMMFSKMKVSNRGVYTAMFDVAIICAGSLSWAIFGILALSVITQYPEWHTDGYTGHWGYTSARFFAFAAWVLTLYLINCYSAYMQNNMKARTI